MKNKILFIILLLTLSSCASKNNDVVEIPEPLEELQSPDFRNRNDGSLWNNTAGSLIADHKARNIGDIVTVVISEKASATREASTSSGRDTSFHAGIPNFFGFEGHHDIVESDIDLSNIINAEFSNSFEGSGRTVRSGDLTASLSTQVIGVYPNGNFKVRGGKEVMVNNEVQVIYLTGIVRPVDITAANTVDSNKILNARITYTGRGPVADKQEPGWLTRTLDYIWPF